MDYRQLLQKYMAHVLSCEGIDFTDRLNDAIENEVAFTEQEVLELKQLSEACARKATSRDVSKAWPVVDGPCSGESIASEHDDLEVLISVDNLRMLVNDPLLPGKTVRYYLRGPENGRYHWSIEPF